MAAIGFVVAWFIRAEPLRATPAPQPAAETELVEDAVPAH
jgi:hypothetical protein